MTGITLVIFDCDGTLVDSQHNITTAMTWAFEQHGLVPPSRAGILRCVGLSLPETFRVLAGTAEPSIQQSLAEHYRNAFTHGPLKRAEEEAIYPGIHETVTALASRPDVLLGVATGKSQRGVKRLFDREGWHPMFATIQTADEHPSKPHPSMIRRAMSDVGADRTRTVMIGDTSFDMEMARNAGVGAIGVDWGYHEPQHLTAAGASRIVSDGARLLRAIDEQLATQGGGGAAMTSSNDDGKPRIPTREINARPLPKRFYTEVSVGAPEPSGVAIRLDGRVARTPKKLELRLPTLALARAIAGEWAAQDDRIDPARMPLTRLANTTIDGVTSREADVRADVVKYAGSDLVCYRAERPGGWSAARPSCGTRLSTGHSRRTARHSRSSPA